MKKWIIFIFCLFFLVGSVVHAATIQWIDLDATVPRDDIPDPVQFDTAWSATLPGWDIVEGSRAWSDWSLTGGSAANKTGYDTNTSKLWMVFGSAYKQFTTPSSSVVFLMHGDFNDGYGNFYVDDVLLDTHDMYDGGPSGRFQAMIVTGLTEQVHTLRVEKTFQKNPSSSGTDLAIIGGGVIAPSSAVPEPATMLLFGFGLLGIAGAGRKRG